MKRILLLTIIILCGVLTQLNAQRFRAGLSAGPVMTDIQGADTRDFDNDFNKLGFAAGGIVNLKLTEQNSFQFEINYITKGSMQKPDSANMGYYKLKLNYLEVPFIFRHRMEFVMNKKPRKHLETEFGASIGRMIKFDEIIDNYSQTFGPNNVHKTDISILFGLNYDINEHFYFGVRYANSVIPALKRNSINPYFVRYTFNNGNNMVWQLSLHFIFGKTAPIPEDGTPDQNQSEPVPNQ
jgi:hypothetical protein